MKKCPFCGGHAKVEKMVMGYWYSYCVECSACKARTAWFTNPNDATKHWNKRKEKDD